MREITRPDNEAFRNGMREVNARVEQGIGDFTGEGAELIIRPSCQRTRAGPHARQRDVECSERGRIIGSGPAGRESTVNLDFTFQTAVVLDLI